MSSFVAPVLGPTARVRPLGGSPVDISSGLGGDIPGLRSNLHTQGIHPQSALYPITDDALWASFQGNVEAQRAFAEQIPNPPRVGDEAPVTAGMRLLAVPPANAGAGVAPPGEAGGRDSGVLMVLHGRKKFEGLLKEAQIRPAPDVMERLLVTRGTEMLLAETPGEAARIYEWAKHLPLTPTKKNFLKETGFILDGPFSSHTQRLITAFGRDGAAYVLKVVDGEDDPEVAAALAISDAPAGVRVVRARYLAGTRPDGRNFCGLLTPCFTRSLASAEVSLSYDVLLAEARNVVAAVNFVHGKGLVHMDIKEGNIFVDASGHWWLGDFGSCVAVGHSIRSTTPVYNPRGSAEGQPAEFYHDWYMLATMILRQLGVDDANGSMGSEAIHAKAHEISSTEGDDREERSELASLVLRLANLNEATC